MGNSSKKHAKQKNAAEGDITADQTVPPSSVTNAISKFEGDDGDTTQASKSDKAKKKEEKLKKKNIKKEKKKEKEDKRRDKKQQKKDKKEKKKIDKKERKNSKKEKGQENEKREPREDFESSMISNGTNCIDITNFNGDTENLSEAVTISVTIEPRKTDEMRGKENTRPVTLYEGRSPRPASPAGPGVSALMEKFGGGGTPRPISYPAPKTPSDSPKAELQHAVHRKSFGYNRLEETPTKKSGGAGLADSNVKSLKKKFGGNKTEISTPTTRQTTPTTTSATPSKFGGSANKGQNKENDRNAAASKSSWKNDVNKTSTPTSTTTATPTTGVNALRSRFNDNAEDRTRASKDEQPSTNPEKKRRIEDERKRTEAVQKENEKNRSPRKRWSPKKEQKATNREGSPTKDTSPRKRKSVVLQKFGKSRQRLHDENEDVTVVQNTTSDNKAEEMQEEEIRKEKARQLILNRTSALIRGANNAPTITTPSRVQFEESVSKRTRRDDKPKERPKTEYNFKNVHSPRPKSMTDTNQLLSSPANVGNTTPPGANHIIKNPTTKTQKLLQWCQIHTQGYADVKVSNFSSSWADGLAFCALVHKFHPTAFDFKSLSSSNRKQNFDLAFSTAEKFSKVGRLIETEDMLIMGDKPDWKCVFTYVTSLYAGLMKHAQ